MTDDERETKVRRWLAAYAEHGGVPLRKIEDDVGWTGDTTILLRRLDEARAIADNAIAGRDDYCAQYKRVSRELVAERDEREKCMTALRSKDEAMGVLFARLRAAGIDYSDLIS